MLDSSRHFLSMKVLIDQLDLMEMNKVPFIYYVSTCILQNFTWIPNFSQKLFFLSKQKNFFFNITFWQNFHDVVWNIYSVHKEKCSKNSWKCCGWKTKCLHNIWMAPKYWGNGLGTWNQKSPTIGKPLEVALHQKWWGQMVEKLQLY